MVAGRRLSPAVAGRTRGAIQTFWDRIAVVELDAALADGAAELAERHRLSGADAIHLASALQAAEGGGEVLFASWDRRLRAAATQERLLTLPA